MNRIIRTVSLAAIAAFLVTGLGRALAADVTITLTAQQLAAIRRHAVGAPSHAGNRARRAASTPDS